MNVTVERVGNDATLKITLPAEEVNKGFKKAVAKIAGQVNIPGFRKGKAPRNIIEMHYGKEAVKQEAFELVANQCYTEALEQEKLIPVSDPKVEDSVFEENKDMELTIKVTLKPETPTRQRMWMRRRKQHTALHFCTKYIILKDGRAFCRPFCFIK